MSHVRLREVRPEDLPVLFANQADPESMRLAMVPTRGREAFDAHWKKLLQDPLVRTLAIEVDGDLAGHIGAWFRGAERQVGYWLGRVFWGRGVATEALKQLGAALSGRRFSALDDPERGLAEGASRRSGVA